MPPLKRTLPLTAAVMLLALSALVATTAPAAAQAQQVATTASNITRVCGPADDVDRPFRGDGSLLLRGPAIVVQTGARPWSGPGIPASQLTGTTDPGGFRFRTFDPDGAAIATADPCVEIYYHASTPMTNGVQAADRAAVRTDAAGYARVRFDARLNTEPVSVVATGATPYRGPGLPMHLVTDGYNTAGFRIRALDQTGAPIAGALIRLHYWATTQPATPNTRAGTRVVTPDSRGVARVTWPRLAVGLPPVAVILTGVAPITGPDMPVNLLAFQTDAGGVSVRALDQSGEPVTTPFRVAFYATKRSVS